MNKITWKNRILALLLAVFMTVGAIPAQAFAEDDSPVVVVPETQQTEAAEGADKQTGEDSVEDVTLVDQTIKATIISQKGEVPSAEPARDKDPEIAADQEKAAEAKADAEPVFEAAQDVKAEESEPKRESVSDAQPEEVAPAIEQLAPMEDLSSIKASSPRKTVELKSPEIKSADTADVKSADDAGAKLSDVADTEVSDVAEAEYAADAKAIDLADAADAEISDVAEAPQTDDQPAENVAEPAEKAEEPVSEPQEQPAENTKEPAVAEPQDQPEASDAQADGQPASEPAEGQPADDQSASQPEVILSGKLPAAGIVTARPVSPEIADLSPIAAFDIKVYANSDKLASDSPWQPQEPIQVRIQSDALAGRTGSLDVYHIADGSDQPEFVATVQPEGSAVEFPAESFSVYMVVDHEEGTIVTPRVVFHFISNGATEHGSGSTAYYEGTPYGFKNKSQSNDTQYTQILKNEESLELIADPVNQGDNYFYGWYVVDPHAVSGTTDDNGIGTSDGHLYYTWPEHPDRITFETSISIAETNVSAGSTVNWTLGDISGSGSVDANGDVHVFLAPLFEKYHFVNFMLRPHDASGSNNLMTRKLVALGSADSVDVKVSDIRSNSTDPIHLVFAGWEYYDNATSQWVTKQTVDYDGSALADSGKDGVYFSVSLTGSESVDLYPVFIEARWVDFFAGVSGSGATYVPSRFLESWGRATETNPPVDEPGKNVFTALDTPTRTGYAFDGWYAFANTNSTTGDITNLSTPEDVEINYISLDGSGNYVTHTVTVNTTAVKVANPDGTIYNCGTWRVTDNRDGTGTLVSSDASGSKLLEASDGKLRFFDALDRLTLYAKWAPGNSEITVIYWTENAQEKGYTAPQNPKDDYTASAVKVITTGELNAQSTEIGATFASGSTLALSQLEKFKDGTISILDRLYLDDAGAVPAGEEKFYDLNSGLSDASVVIRGDGSTTYNVYFSRKTFKLVFHIGRDGYVKNGGHQKTDDLWDGNWIEFMYKDAKVTALGYPTPGGTGRAPADSIKGVFSMTYKNNTPDDSSDDATFTSEYVTTNANVMGDYDPVSDTNLYVLAAKYGAYIGDRWPTPTNPNFSFTDAAGKGKTLYIWAAYYGSLYCRIANERSTAGNAQGANPDINGIYEYMSAELCSNRAGDDIINANQVHHLVAYYGNSNNNNRFKQYHILYEAIPGTYDPAHSTVVQGDDYIGYNLTTWSQEHTAKDKSEIIGHSFIEQPDSPKPVISNLEPQFQLTDSINGYEQIYSCYDPTQRPNSSNPSQMDFHIYFFFTPKQYTLTFNFGSTTKVDTYRYTQSLSDADKYTGDVTVPEGYYFKGWYTNAEGIGDPFDFAHETMPNQNVVLYPVLKPLQYTVKIDPNGGILDHRANASVSTYFTANYGTPVGEYTTKREYIKLTDKELTPGDPSYYSGDKYYYINTQRLEIPSEGNWGLPAELRNAIYLTEEQLDDYYNNTYLVRMNAALLETDAAGHPYWEGIQILTKEDFKTAYADYPYRPVSSGGEHYTFMGWYKVADDGSVSSMPYNFNDPVKGPLELRAMWRLDGGIYVQYNPYYLAESGGVVTAVVGEVQQWTDPADPTLQLYADQSPTHILKAPTNVTSGWVFRGWRVVRKNGEKTYTDGLGTHTYDNWEPFGDPNYYQPGDNFTIDSELVTEINSNGKVIHMQAYYELETETYRRPEVTNLILDANDDHGGYVNTSDSTSLPAIAGPGSTSINTTDELDTNSRPTQILLGDIQSNLALHLFKYATTHTHYGETGTNFFTNVNGHLLIGFDENADPASPTTNKPYIPAYAADSVVAATRNSNVTLYALWEPMVYATFVNTTDAPITVTLSGTGADTVSIVNQVTGEFDREEKTTTITIPAKSGTENGKVKVVFPKAVAGTDSITATATNDHLRKKMSVAGEFPVGTAYGTGSTDIKNGQTVTYTGTLRTDSDGIVVTYTEEIDAQVIYDVNGGTWNPLPVADPFKYSTGDLYYIEAADIINGSDYEPADPTRSGKIFIGWTTNADIAAHTDFSSASAVTWGSTTITPDADGIVLDKVRSDYIWDFSQDAELLYNNGETLFAVWSDTVTVTFDIVRAGANLHKWQGPATTTTDEPYKFYRSSDTSGAITYMLAKGERVPKPSDPMANPSTTGWRFVAWLLSFTNYSNTPKQPSDANIRSKSYDFSLRVTNDITLSTSWTTNQPQTFTFIVRNEVVNGNEGEEFTYVIAVSDMKLIAKVNGQNTVVDSETTWEPVSVQLKNNEEYSIIITVSYNTESWEGNSVKVEVINREGIVIKTAQLMTYSTQGKPSFASDYKYTLSITQAEKAGYTTTVGTQDLVGSIVFDQPDSATRTFTFVSSESRTPSTGVSGAVANAEETFNNPEVNNYATGKTGHIINDFKNKTNGIRDSDYYTHPGDNSLTIVFTNTGAIYAAPTNYHVDVHPFALMLGIGAAMVLIAFAGRMPVLAAGGTGRGRARGKAKHISGPKHAKKIWRHGA